MQSSVAVAVLRRLANTRLRRSEDGQDLLEYGLLAALISIVAIAAVTSVGNAIGGTLWNYIANTANTF